MNARLFDWIWHIRGSLALAPGQSADEAFDRLDPLFQQGGTSHLRSGDTLTFTKKDQAAQDKMSIFDGGVLQVCGGLAGPVLHYHMTSKALLFCFLAPLLFLAFGQLNVVLGKLESPQSEASKKKEEALKKKNEAMVLPQHPIDKFLGAPAPEMPKKDDEKAKGKDKKDDKKDGDKDDKGHSPTSAYVFAGIFAALYVAGRVLEARLIKSLFRKRLLGA